MFWLVFKCILAALVAYFVYKVVTIQLQIWRLQKQGIHFLSKYPIFDTFKILKYVKQSKGEDHYMKFFYDDVFGKEKKTIPPMTGVCLFNVPTVYIHDPVLLEDIYVKQNKYYTKHQSMTLKTKPLTENGLLAIPTEHEEYPLRRKSVSSAFFKSKVDSMSKVIKEVTLEHIARLTNAL